MAIRGLNQSKYGGDGGLNIKRYLGKHLVRVNGAENTVSGRDKKDMWIPQLQCLKSSNEKFQELIDSCDGSVDCGDVYKCTGYTYLFDSIKRFIGAILDKDPADDSVDWDTEMGKVENGDYNGTLLGCVVYDTGKVFTQGKLMNEPITETRFEHLGKKG